MDNREYSRERLRADIMVLTIEIKNLSEKITETNSRLEKWELKTEPLANNVNLLMEDRKSIMSPTNLGWSGIITSVIIGIWNRFFHQ